MVRASSLGELVLADEEEGDRLLDDRAARRSGRAGRAGSASPPSRSTRSSSTKFIKGYCAAAADLLRGRVVPKRGMLLGLGFVCDLSMKRGELAVVMT